MSLSDAPETQAERTRLAWRRTMIGILAVAGFGAYHFLTVSKPYGALTSGSVALLACIPMEYRRDTLRSGGRGPARWEMLAVAGCCVALALGVVVA